jgi:hypothetical protein
MLSPVSRFVHYLTHYQNLRLAIHNSGRTPFLSIYNILMSPQSFPKFLGCSMMLSGLTGYITMDYIQQRQWEVRTGIGDLLKSERTKS